MTEKNPSSTQLDENALHYHRYPRPGKLEIQATKPLGNQRDLALAYSPGVAEPCRAIAADPAAAFDYTARGNLVAVVSNGTAVLGLGAIGPLASKPVMEGKAVLFKKFAGIDVFDIEVDATEIDRFVDVVAALEPTFGGINLEDIKAPECFEIEARLRERMGIPVFHDDQHGTAIIVAAAVLNALELAGKQLADGEDRHLRRRRGGARLPRPPGAPRRAAREHLGDRHRGRGACRPRGADGSLEGGLRAGDRRRAASARSIDGADVFLGLSAGGVLKPEMVAKMAERPLILALANPAPEIMPEEARAVRPDAMICTGRSDYPNQVNNVLCFPYIFRGALDVGARAINEEMKMAAVEAIAALAREEPSDVVARAYGGETRHLRAGLSDPHALRPAADPEDRAGGGQRGDGVRRRRAADRGFRRLQRPADRLRAALRPDHEADDRGGASRSRSASSTPRARTSACCAPRRSRWRKASPCRSSSAGRRWWRAARSATA